MLHITFLEVYLKSPKVYFLLVVPCFRSCSLSAITYACVINHVRPLDTLITTKYFGYEVRLMGSD